MVLKDLKENITEERIESLEQSIKKLEAKILELQREIEWVKRKTNTVDAFSIKRI